MNERIAAQDLMPMAQRLLREARGIQYTPDYERRARPKGFWERLRRVFVAPKIVDRWQEPEATDVLRQGDCEDIAAWLVWRMQAAGLSTACLGFTTYEQQGLVADHVVALWPYLGEVFLLDATTPLPVIRWQARPLGYGSRVTMRSLAWYRQQALAQEMARVKRVEEGK